MTRGDKGKLFILFVPLFILSLCVLPVVTLADRALQVLLKANVKCWQITVHRTTSEKLISFNLQPSWSEHFSRQGIIRLRSSFKVWLSQSKDSTVDVLSGENTKREKRAFTWQLSLSESNDGHTFANIETEVECQCSLLKSPCQLLQCLALHNKGRQRISSVIQSSRFG